MFHVKHFNSFNVGVSDQTKTAGDAHLINVSLREKPIVSAKPTKSVRKRDEKRTALLPK
jgi:hypothetical protein